MAAAPCDKVSCSQSNNQSSSDKMTARAILDGLFRTAIAAAHPSNCLPQHLPPAPESGRLIVLAAGKAAGSMAEVAEAAYAGLGRAAHRHRRGAAGLWAADPS